MQARMTLGSAALKMKDFATAAEEFEQIIVNNPTDAYAFYGCSVQSYLGRAQLENAEKYLQKALEIDPKFAEAYYQLGWVYRERSQTEKAIESFKRSIALQPNLAAACNTLAWYYVEQEATFG